MRQYAALVTWWEYVQQHAGGDTNEKIGAKTGVTGATVGRWNQSEPGPHNVAAFARAYRRPVLEAFVAAGYLTREEAGRRITVNSVSPGEWSDEEIVRELTNRLANLRRAAGREDEFPSVRGQVSLPPPTPFQLAADDQPEEPVGQRARREQDEAAERGDG